MSRQQIVAAALVIASITTIAALTLTSQAPGKVPDFFCMLCDERWLVDVVLNVLLFLPLGVGLERWGMSARRAFLISVVLSTVVEFLQATVVTGRDPSFRDIATNSTGGWLGAALTHSWRDWVWPEASRRRCFALAMGTLWPTVIVATLWSLQPSISNSRYFGHYAPTDSGLPEFRGKILKMTFRGSPLPRGAFTDQVGVAEAFRARQAWLTATVSEAPTIAWPATIVAIVDQREREALTLSQSGADLLCHVRLRSEDLGLNSPILRLNDALTNGESETPIEIEGGLLGATIAVVARRGINVSRIEVPLTPGAGWMLLYPFDVTTPAVAAVLGLLWMMVITVPLQYLWSLWAIMERRSVGFRLLPLFLAVVVVVVGPPAFGAASATIFEITGVAVGLIAGDRLAQLAKALAQRTKLNWET